MKITKIVNRDVEEIDDLVCNLCGGTLKQIISTDGMYNFCGLEEVSMNCGYGSLNDGTTFTFSLCEKCVEELMSKFKIPAEKEDIWDIKGMKFLGKHKCVTCGKETESFTENCNNCKL